MNFVAAVKPLMAKGSLKWSDKFSTGPLPVTMAWMKNPNIENIACMQHALLHPVIVRCCIIY